MKKLLLTFSLLTLIHAQDAKIDADLGIGYRSDWIEINTFDNDGTLSTNQKFDDFNMPNLEGSFRGNFTYFVLFAEGSYGRFWNGQEKFLFIVPIGVTTFTPPLIQEDLIRFKTAGYATSASGGGGFPIPIINTQSIRLSIIPIAGYRYDHIRMKQMDPNPDPRVSSAPPLTTIIHFYDLSSRKFDLTLEGPYIGANLDFSIAKFSLETGYSYHWARSRQQAKLGFSGIEFAGADNPILAGGLVNDLLIQSKKNRGHQARIKLSYHLFEHFYLAASGKYLNYNKDKNSERTVIRQITRVTIPPLAPSTNLVQNLFDMKWSFFSVMLEMGFSI